MAPPRSTTRRAELHGIVGAAAAMQEVYNRILRFAGSSVPLMITGETGTGKEMVAQAVRRMAGRSVPFVAVNCAAIPETLVESELFGHERGAFTGALHRREGLLAQANGGILFLDEVGELSLTVQAKLLRAVEVGEYRAVGATRETHVHFRLITATNRDLKRMAAEHRFRADLLHRLGTARIHVPPLRERRDDIPLLADHFLGLLRGRETDVPPCTLSADALEMCGAAEWPGNVRQLRNVLETAAVNAAGTMLEPEHFRELVLAEPVQCEPFASFSSLKEGMRVRERELIRDALARAQGNREEAAQLLGISVATLYRRLAALGLAA